MVEVFKAVIPLRLYLIAAGILAALILFGWYSAHERSIQHQKDIQTAYRALDEQKARNADQEAIWRGKLAKATHDYQSEIEALRVVESVPVPVVRLCKYASSGTVPSTAGAGTSSAPATGSGGKVHEVGPDIGPALLDLARQYDLKIAEVREALGARP